MRRGDRNLYTLIRIKFTMKVGYVSNISWKFVDVFITEKNYEKLLSGLYSEQCDDSGFNLQSKKYIFLEADEDTIEVLKHKAQLDVWLEYKIMNRVIVPCTKVKMYNHYILFGEDEYIFATEEITEGDNMFLNNIISFDSANEAVHIYSTEEDIEVFKPLMIAYYYENVIPEIKGKFAQVERKLNSLQKRHQFLKKQIELIDQLYDTYVEGERK